ncbi:hypothetical protein [Hoylesella nanceiensis]|uniref:hypothetical protein n=1 Tax=Hoylesella nanceiensis TaxID=425941 RepID=UPI0028ED7669|nr:hypothetical protein [Hoylesella nanceiensis]
MRIHLYASALLEKDDYKSKFINILQHYLSLSPDVVLTAENPDIVHVFDGKDKRNITYSVKLYNMEIPVLLSSLNSFLPWNNHRKKAKKGVLKPKKYPIVKFVTAFHASGQLEYNQLTTLAVGKNTRLIENSVITNSITDELMAQQFVEYYKEILVIHDQFIKEKINQKVSKLITSDVDVNGSMKKLCSMFLYIEYLYRRHNIPFSILQELSTTMFEAEYNEDKFAEYLETLKITNFVSSLESVLFSRSLLTEGFMPIAFKEGKLADKIENLITNYSK